jgi:flagellar L-ring protein precursor FlgH
MSCAKTAGHKEASKMPTRTLLVVTLAVALSGCAGQLDSFGKPPTMTAPANPQVAAPLPDLLRIPQPVRVPEAPSPAGSVYRTGSNSFFGDQRARRVGDILTVIVKIDDEAKFDNQSRRSRKGSTDAGVTGLLGFEGRLDRILPDDVDNEELIGINGKSTTTGAGAITRKEAIETKVAAIIHEILPNGNLIIQGSQEVRVNFELRDLQVSGIIRPEDVARNNTITSDKIAEARINYGGRGQITTLQQPTWGQQVIDIVSPF